MNLNPLEIILTLCKCLGIASPKQMTKICKIYQIFLLSISVLGYVYSVYGKQTAYFNRFNHFVKLFDQISSFFLLGIVFTAGIMVLVYPSRWQVIVDSLKNFDRSIEISSKKMKKTFWIFFISVHCMVIGAICADASLWLNTATIHEYQYYLVRSFQYYQMTVSIFLWFWVVMEVRNRFMLLNNKLEDLLKVPDYRSIFHIHEKRRRMHRKLNIQKELKSISKLHNYLSDVVNDVNSSFGTILLFYVLFIITYFVTQMILMIVSTTLMEKLNSDTEGLQYVAIIWLFDMLIKLIAVAKAGDCLTKEARNTIIICYGILNVENTNAEYDSDVVKEELKLLSQQVAYRNTHLSASGFFVADFTMIGFIVTSITSFVIVAVQFMKETSVY